MTHFLSFPSEASTFIQAKYFTSQNRIRHHHHGTCCLLRVRHLGTFSNNKSDALKPSEVYLSFGVDWLESGISPPSLHNL
ncbi:hypothetical protein CIPAW_02G010500 [Carya illinoinensis]|uniref:Uncharacterized protein n=1 Tax=Carya illinoinensis TaxID=32201 RepID=A0A8T1RAU0_CARIL|nr:hypothetical protein CIPAW_02G010500 [Carya illinoinensis]